MNLWDMNQLDTAAVVKADPAPVTKYQSHSETSREAAREIQPTAGTLRAQVLDYIRECGERGATDEEQQIGLDMNPSTQRPRRVELAERGLIEKRGQRPTRSGRNAVVWVYRMGGAA